MGRRRAIYLDYAAATPVDPRVFRAMRPYFSEKFGNPGSVHRAGAEALQALDRARETIANLAGVPFRNVIFTASATEANNLGIRGVISKWKLVNGREGAQLPITNYQLPPKLIVSAIEHDSVLETARDMERAGEIELAVIPVDKRGVVDIKKLEAALDERTVLVSVMYVNNEIGTVQPLSAIADVIRKWKLVNRKNAGATNYQLPITNYPLLHSDCAQAFLYHACGMEELGVDLMTLSSQKIYGPKGVGALCINSKHEVRNPKQIQNPKSQIKNVSNFYIRISDLPVMSPLITGGGQEFGLRAGTENVPAIVGFAAATALAEKERGKNKERVARVRDAFVAELKKELSGVEENLPTGRAGAKGNAPHIANIAFPKGISSEDLLVLFDREGIAASPGAACSARALTLSHVLRAIGVPDERIARSIRFSFGRSLARAGALEAARRVARAARSLLEKKTV